MGNDQLHMFLTTQPDPEPAPPLDPAPWWQNPPPGSRWTKSTAKREHCARCVTRQAETYGADQPGRGGVRCPVRWKLTAPDQRTAYTCGPCHVHITGGSA